MLVAVTARSFHTVCVRYAPKVRNGWGMDGQLSDELHLKPAFAFANAWPKTERQILRASRDKRTFANTQIGAMDLTWS
jgi:hypothetical protein